MVAEAIGSSGDTTIAELDVLANSQIAAFALYEGGTLVRAVFVNLKAYEGGSGRSSVHITPQMAEGGYDTMQIARLSIPCVFDWYLYLAIRSVRK